MKEFEKCQIYETPFTTGDIVHEVPNVDDIMIKLCSNCYTSIYRQWRIK